jgi:hypothetical protein
VNIHLLAHTTITPDGDIRVSFERADCGKTSPSVPCPTAKGPSMARECSSLEMSEEQGRLAAALFAVS